MIKFNIINIIPSITGIISIISLFVTINSFRKKKHKRAIIFLIITLVLFIYADIVIEHKSIIEAYNTRSFKNLDWVVANFFNKYHRYPISTNEIVTTSNWSAELYKEFYQYHTEVPWYWYFRPYLHLVKWPDYGIKTYLDDTLNPKVDKALVTPLGIKTYLNDTILYCVSYSYGFDNDDDSLKVVYTYYELYDARKLNNILYMISPIPLNGDIFLGWDVRSVNDYRLDTTFVRQLRELQGDTLTPEEYEESMRKREEFRRKEFRLE